MKHCCSTWQVPTSTDPPPSYFIYMVFMKCGWQHPVEASGGKPETQKVFNQCQLNLKPEFLKTGTLFVDIGWCVWV